MKNLLAVILFIISALFTSACKSNSQDLQKNIEQLTKTVEKAVDNSNIPTSVSEVSEEVKKLHAFEYKVVEFPRDTEASAISAKLNELGKERWNCEKFLEGELSISLVCKRHPKSVLRYIPYSLFQSVTGSS